MGWHKTHSSLYPPCLIHIHNVTGRISALCRIVRAVCLFFQPFFFFPFFPAFLLLGTKPGRWTLRSGVLRQSPGVFNCLWLSFYIHFLPFIKPSKGRLCNIWGHPGVRIQIVTTECLFWALAHKRALYTPSTSVFSQRLSLEYWI